MKRITALLCALALAISMAACGGDAPAAPADTGYPVEAMSLTEAMEKILDGVEDLPDYEIAELTADNFEFFTFIPYAEGSSAAAADALIGSVPHSVVLVRTPAEKAAEAEEDIRQNADPRKWICVEAEATLVRRYGDTILLVMSGAVTANAILQNFDALNGVETPESDLAVPAPAEDELEELPEDVLNQPAAPAEGPEGVEDMPALTPEDGDDGNMPVPDPGSAAVEMPNAAPDAPAAAPQPVPAPSKPAAPEAPVTVPAPEPAPAPAPEPVPEPEPEPAPPAESGTDLSAVMASILSGVELPAVGEAELTAETFEFYAFLPYAEGWRGLVSEAMMNAVAHSVVLVEVPAGADAAQAAQDMLAKADPRKWICVEAESVQTASKGSLALLVMSDQATADAIIANFNAL